MRLMTLHRLGMLTNGIKTLDGIFTLGAIGSIKTDIQILGAEGEEVVYHALPTNNTIIYRKADNCITRNVGLWLQSTARTGELAAICGSFVRKDETGYVFEKCLSGVKILASGHIMNSGAEYFLQMMPGSSFTVVRHFPITADRQYRIVSYDNDDLAIYTPEGYLNREADGLKYSKENNGNK